LGDPLRILIVLIILAGNAFFVVAGVRARYREALPDESVVPTGEGTFLVHGTFPIDDFNEQLGQRLPLEDHHTLAGFVFGLLGRAPVKGDEVGWNGVRFRVVRTRGRTHRPSGDRPPSPELGHQTEFALSCASRN
jgi:hypothetical protein